MSAALLRAMSEACPSAANMPECVQTRLDRVVVFASAGTWTATAGARGTTTYAYAAQQRECEDEGQR